MIKKLIERPDFSFRFDAMNGIGGSNKYYFISLKFLFIMIGPYAKSIFIDHLKAN
jgi:hypothetical protein